MTLVKLYIEGGGNRKLDLSLREAFRMFFSGLRDSLRQQGHELTVITKGDRPNTYDWFRTAVNNPRDNEFPVLLVDAEEPIAPNSTCRNHLKNSDNWDISGFDESQCYLMVIMMESWFYAQQQVVETYFGQGFRANQMSNRNDIENIPKQVVLSGLEEASRHCKKKGMYSKGSHSAEILRRLDADAVRQRSPHCDRIFTEILTAV